MSRKWRRRASKPAQAEGHFMNSKTTVAIALAGAWIGCALYRRATRYSFRDRVVIVTGGSRGLGLVMARQLVEEGAKVALLARDKNELQNAAEMLAGIGT